MDRTRYQYSRGSIVVPARERIVATDTLQHPVKTSSRPAKKALVTPYDTHRQFQQQGAGTVVQTKKLPIAQIFAKPKPTVMRETVPVETVAKALGFSSPARAVAKTSPKHLDEIVQIKPRAVAAQSRALAKKIVPNPVAERGKKSLRKTDRNAKKPKSSKKSAILNSLRYSLVAIVLVVSGYLAYDTWVTNRQARDVFSASASALSEPDNATGPDVDETSVSNESKAAYTVAPDMPRYLSIPSQGVANTRVLNVGITNAGEIGVPKSIHDTGWYSGSSRPGKTGAAFIDGHYAGASLSAVFNGLEKMKQGEIITVEMGNGTKYSYKVLAVETVPLDQVDMNKALKVYGGGEEGLNLMTCAGNYDSSSQNYDKRTVVYAVRA